MFFMLIADQYLENCEVFSPFFFLSLLFFVLFYDRSDLIQKFFYLFSFFCVHYLLLIID